MVFCYGGEEGGLGPGANEATKVEIGDDVGRM